MSEEVDNLLSKVKKHLKGVHISVMTDSEIANVTELIKTPALDLNRILSGNLNTGVPTRSVVGIAGPEGSFKSSFAIICAADASKNGFQPILIDTEGGLKADFCARWGLDTSKTIYFYSQWYEEIIVFLAQLKDSGMQKMIIVLDSIGGIDRLKTYDDALDGDPKADQGQLQRNIKSMIKMISGICVLQNSVAILTGHLYGSPGGMFVSGADKVGGGYAFKYLPSIAIQLKKQTLKDEDNVIIGNTITAYTTKNRFHPPFQEATIEIDYINGINPYAGIVNLAIKAGIIKQSGSWYTYGEEKWQGITKMTDALKDLPRLIDDLNVWLKSTGYSTVNENLKQAEELLLETVKSVTPDVVEKNNNSVTASRKRITKKKV